MGQGQVFGVFHVKRQASRQPIAYVLLSFSILRGELMPAPNQTGPLHLTQDEHSGGHFLIYETNKGACLELRYAGETFWMTQDQMASLFGIERSGVTKHLQNIFSERELEEHSVCEESSRTAADGKSYKVQHYNLDAVISVGYRVSSTQGTIFRKWATGVLVQLATKGFVVDLQRLKNPAENDRVAELREIIRDIRTSEANLYAELQRICSMCQDYDPNSQAARDFYSHTQAKLFWAVTSHTPSEIVAERANAALPDMGLRAWSKSEIRKEDAKVAKNYLAPNEIEEHTRSPACIAALTRQPTNRREFQREIRSIPAGRGSAFNPDPSSVPQ